MGKSFLEIWGKPFKGTVIEDEVLEPFVVVKYADGGFGVLEKTYVEEKDRYRLRVCSYPSTFSSCLHTVAQEKLNSQKEYKSIQEYVDTWKKLTEGIREAYKEWNVEKL